MEHPIATPAIFVKMCLQHNPKITVGEMYGLLVEFQRLNDKFKTDMPRIKKL